MPADPGVRRPHLGGGRGLQAASVDLMLHGRCTPTPPHRRIRRCNIPWAAGRRRAHVCARPGRRMRRQASGNLPGAWAGRRPGAGSATGATLPRDFPPTEATLPAGRPPSGAGLCLTGETFRWFRCPGGVKKRTGATEHRAGSEKKLAGGRGGSHRIAIPVIRPGDDGRLSSTRRCSPFAPARRTN